jgi:AbrB family looped-hinge helix DNA binding protein
MGRTEELDATVQVRLNGRVTLPFEIRQALGIKDGDLVHIKVSKVVPEGISSSEKNPLEAVTAA